MDHYTSLGVSRDSTFEEIKKAYRQLALIHHPDKSQNNDDSTFKELTLAYSVLGDEEKRKDYDMFGSLANFPDLSDLFDDVLHSARNFKDFVFKRQADILDVTLDISLSSVDEGVIQAATFEINDKCDVCDGIGAKSKEDVTVCITCNGTGHVFAEVAANLMADSCCSSCFGKKCYIKINKICAGCNGNQTVLVTKTVDVKVPKGVPDGHVHRLIGKGSYNQSKGEYDDVRIVFHYVYNKRCVSVHEGNDVSVTIDLRLDEVLTGFSKVINLFEKPVEIKSSKYIDPTKMAVIPQRGLPIYKTDLRGDLYISFNVSYPSTKRLVKYHDILLRIFKRKNVESLPSSNVITNTINLDS